MIHEKSIELPTAYFVKYPRNVAEIRQPHNLRAEKPYEIVKTIVLEPIDYENFITDLYADRQFLEDNAYLCAIGDTMRCLFVHQQGHAEGVLAIADTPHNPSHLKFAAYLSIPPSD